MEELLLDLLEGEVTKSFFWKAGSKKPVTISSGLDKVLDKVSKHFNVELHDTKDFFTDPIDPLDSTDIINPE